MTTDNSITKPSVTGHEDLLAQLAKHDLEPTSNLQMQRWIQSSRGPDGNLPYHGLHDDQYHMTVGDTPVIEELSVKLAPGEPAPEMKQAFNNVRSTPEEPRNILPFDPPKPT
jgi:hypothetical protein